MRIPDELYTILRCALWLNLLTTLYRFWPRRAQMQASAVSNHRDTVWTWKDTIWLIIILISTGLICALPFIFLANSHEAVRKVIDRERDTEYDGWAMQMGPEEEFKPQPESYWTDRYEKLLDSTVEFVPEKRN